MIVDIYGAALTEKSGPLFYGFIRLSGMHGMRRPSKQKSFPPGKEKYKTKAGTWSITMMSAFFILKKPEAFQGMMTAPESLRMDRDCFE